MALCSDKDIGDSMIHNKIKFVRFGGLSSVIQNGYNPAMLTGHAPPARRGIYAFVYPLIESFLIGSSVLLSHRMEWVKDKDGNKISEEHPDFKKYYNDNVTLCKQSAKEGSNCYLANHKKRKVFEYSGLIWSHLDIKKSEILFEKGSWIYTDFETYKRALNKELGCREHYKKRTGCGYSIDHLEVFIEKV